MITGMNHVAISVSNLERAIAFYREILGLELAGPIIPFNGPLFAQIQALENPEGRIGFMSDGGTLQIELFEFANPQPAPKDPNHSVADRGITHFCVDVTDIDAEYARMLAAGVQFHCPVLTFPGAGTKAAYARDLDGNIFELVEKAKATAGA
jgi:catechol 2,3-dioxygenase-like lactoylglutathione lyase family enzyme